MGNEERDVVTQNLFQQKVGAARNEGRRLVAPLVGFPGVNALSLDSEAGGVDLPTTAGKVPSDVIIMGDNTIKEWRSALKTQKIPAKERGSAACRPNSK